MRVSHTAMVTRLVLGTIASGRVVYTPTNVCPTAAVASNLAATFAACLRPFAPGSQRPTTNVSRKHQPGSLSWAQRRSSRCLSPRFARVSPYHESDAAPRQPTTMVSLCLRLRKCRLALCAIVSHRSYVAVPFSTTTTTICYVCG